MELYKSQQQPPKSPGRQVAPVRCTKCDLTFTSKKLLAAHAKGVHANKVGHAGVHCGLIPSCRISSVRHVLEDLRLEVLSKTTWSVADANCSGGIDWKSRWQTCALSCKLKIVPWRPAPKHLRATSVSASESRTIQKTLNLDLNLDLKTVVFLLRYVSLRGVTEHKKRCHTNSNQSDRSVRDWNSLILFCFSSGCGWLYIYSMYFQCRKIQMSVLRAVLHNSPFAGTPFDLGAPRPVWGIHAGAHSPRTSGEHLITSRCNSLPTAHWL